MNQAVLDEWTRFRKSGGPICFFAGPDPAETIATLVEAEGVDKVTALRWDISRGIEPLTDLGSRALSDLLPKPPPGTQSAGNSTKALTKQPADALSLAYRLPEKSIFFMMNAQLYLSNEAVTQAIWNTRDQFKEIGATLVMLGPSVKLPPHLVQDVAVFNEPLPTPEDLRRIATSIHRDANDERKKKKLELIPAIAPETLDRVVGALGGLAAFPAEQAVAMNLTEKGINVGGVWQRKMSMISQMPGVTVWQGNERFEELKGQDNAQDFGLGLLNGREPFTLVCIFDEAEKTASGTPGDLSGVSQELHGYMLSQMQDKDYPGMILLGPGGSGKTAYLKALANMAPGGKILSLIVNLAGMKSSLIGSSMANMVSFFNLVEAISGGRPLFGFTCNSFDFSPEFQRRCYLGKWFFDLPSDEERGAIWPIYLRKYELGKQPLPDDKGWTGAEIRACSMLAYRLSKPLVECAKFIVPIAVSAAEKIDTLRQEADGKFTSASKPGPYKYSQVIQNVRRGRLIDGSQTQN